MTRRLQLQPFGKSMDGLGLNTDPIFLLSSTVASITTVPQATPIHIWKFPNHHLPSKKVVAWSQQWCSTHCMQACMFLFRLEFSKLGISNGPQGWVWALAFMWLYTKLTIATLSAPEVIRGWMAGRMDGSTSNAGKVGRLLSWLLPALISHPSCACSTEAALGENKIRTSI